MDSVSTELTSEERHKILFDWNKTDSPYPRDKTLAQLFEEQVQKNPEHTALIYKNRMLSYQALNAKANQLAHYLRAKKISRNDLVGICVDPGFDLIITILAILKVGACYIPLDPHNPIERQQLILSDAQAKLLITQSDHALQFGDIKTKICCLDELTSQISSKSQENLLPNNSADDLAYIIYTSGSTGKPKGVMITQGNIICFIYWFSKALGNKPDDIFDFSSSVSFDFSVANMLFPLMQGASIAICPEENKRDPYLFLEHLNTTRATILKITPSHFRQLKDVVLSEEKPINLKTIVFGGETLFARDINDWLNRFPEQLMFCEYGPTETTVATSWIKVNKKNIDAFTDKIPIGKPALNTQLYILNPSLEPCGIGEIGELYIGGDHVGKGYFKHPELTKKKFINDFFKKKQNAKLYKTGDLCRYLPDGNIEFVDRIDHQIKIRGFRIEMQEIEKVLKLHRDIKDVVVIAYQNKENPTAEKQLIAYCVFKKNKKINIQALRLFLAQHLPDYMVPSFFEVLAKLPLSASGKVDRNNLPEPLLKVHAKAAMPHSEIEQNLLSIWTTVLNLKNIDLTDNFFDLGGNSLTAARIVTKIRTVLKKEIKLQDFYNSPTIKQLANTTKKAKDLHEIHSEVTFDGNHIPLNEMQFLFWLIHSFYPKAKIANIVNRNRIKGRIDPEGLEFALQCLVKKHPILTYQFSRFVPVQAPRKKASIKIKTKDLSAYPQPKKENILFQSLNELLNYTWPSHTPFVTLRLFYLEDELTEMQIACAHLVGDEISTQIMLEDLSHFYFNYTHQLEMKSEAEKIQYKDYIFQEKNYLKLNLKKDILFWEKYLNQVPVLSFPQNYLNSKPPSSYTVYLEIPASHLQNLQSFCLNYQLSLTHSLCATVGYVLKSYILGDNKTLVINLVKSTRENEIYDNTIGLFVRSDLIKMNFNGQNNLLQLSKQVQNAIAESSSYQNCPIIVKLACLLKKGWEKKKVLNFFIYLLAKTYSAVFSLAKLNPLVLVMFLRVFAAQKKHHFFVDVNITNHFIVPGQTTNLFGYDIAKHPAFLRENLVDKNVINIWFERDHQNKAYISLSGNMKTSYLLELGNQMIDMIGNPK